MIQRFLPTGVGVVGWGVTEIYISFLVRLGSYSNFTHVKNYSTKPLSPKNSIFLQVSQVEVTFLPQRSKGQVSLLKETSVSRRSPKNSLLLPWKHKSPSQEVLLGCLSDSTQQPSTCLVCCIATVRQVYCRAFHPGP